MTVSNEPPSFSLDIYFFNLHFDSSGAFAGFLIMFAILSWIRIWVYLLYIRWLRLAVSMYHPSEVGRVRYAASAAGLYLILELIRYMEIQFIAYFNFWLVLDILVMGTISVLVLGSWVLSMDVPDWPAEIRHLRWDVLRAYRISEIDERMEAWATHQNINWTRPPYPDDVTETTLKTLKRALRKAESPLEGPKEIRLRADYRRVAPYL